MNCDSARAAGYALLVAVLFAAPAIAKVRPEIPRLEKATFAAGCFWSIQPPFDKTPGVLKTTVGFTGGTVPHPSYEQVSAGNTGHAESIEVLYDPAKVSYTQLLDVFWHNIDPTTRNRQFPDSGPQYRTAIFYHNPDQQMRAMKSKERLDKSGIFGTPIVTEIQPAGEFWPAEEYHQKYCERNPEAYNQYRSHSGRDPYFKKIWGVTPAH
jgi:peptide-methionine (S)-S-oxide reductase